jgi:hypothetical protein
MSVVLRASERFVAFAQTSRQGGLSFTVTVLSLSLRVAFIRDDFLVRDE